MKANELRIGNIVNVGIIENMLESGVHVGKGKCYIYSEFEPIPLTEEWLLKFGFEITYSSNFRLKLDHKTHNEIGFDFSHVADNSMEGFRFYGHYIKIQYIHQLQNLYFALTNKELTLKQ